MRAAIKKVEEIAESLVDCSQIGTEQSDENEGKMRKILAQMRSAVPEAELASINFEGKAFLSLYRRFINLNNRDPLDWNKIQQLDENHVRTN